MHFFKRLIHRTTKRSVSFPRALGYFNFQYIFNNSNGLFQFHSPKKEYIWLVSLTGTLNEFDSEFLKLHEKFLDRNKDANSNYYYYYTYQPKRVIFSSIHQDPFHQVVREDSFWRQAEKLIDTYHLILLLFVLILSLHRTSKCPFANIDDRNHYLPFIYLLVTIIGNLTRQMISFVTTAPPQKCFKGRKLGIRIFNLFPKTTEARFV